jgi:hypothetical protein
MEASRRQSREKSLEYRNQSRISKTISRAASWFQTVAEWSESCRVRPHGKRDK